MKTLKTILIGAIFFLAVFSISSCSKDAGVGGNASISGTVSNTNGPVSGAIVYITYGSTDAATTFDNSTVSGTDGTYKIDGLQKGDYFVTAKYTDEYGDNFGTGGYGVTIGDKKGDVTVDITLE